MSLFSRRSCGVCAAKDAHIHALEAQILMLQRLAIPQVSPPRENTIQADAIFSGNIETTTLSTDEREQALANFAQAEAMLTGSYS